ncbi:MAG: hypothetical protein HYV63_28680 [Candidatus Schekmanbacteria bacterium]|nr:hypothetical protein [Candidatus Schekmanbacteria bacterium]
MFLLPHQPSAHGRLSGLLCATLMLASGCDTYSVYGAADSAPPLVSLDGTWAFRVGDDPTWASPSFDDSHWISLRVPGAWPNEAAPGVAAQGKWGWYRRRVRLPHPAECERCWREGLGLVPGMVGDAYELYVNGTRLGGGGAFPPAAVPKWDRQQIFPVPVAVVRQADPLVVCLRVWSEPWQRASKSGPWGGMRLLGPLGQVRDDDALPATFHQSLDLVARNGRRLLRQVDLLLDFARIEARRVELSLTPIAAIDLVHGVLPEVVAAAQTKGVTVGIEGLEEAAARSLVVEVDLQRMEQVLLNLLGNALKFTPRGGQILVRLERGGGEARICIRDTGVGIPAEELPLLFSPFRRAPARSRGEGSGSQYRREQSGTGLGLALAREIVVLHGGRIEVESAVGRGSEFRVVLAAWDAGVAAGSGAVSPRERAPRTELADVEAAAESAR